MTEALQLGFSIVLFRQLIPNTVCICTRGRWGGGITIPVLSVWLAVGALVLSVPIDPESTVVCWGVGCEVVCWGI